MPRTFKIIPQLASLFFIGAIILGGYFLRQNLDAAHSRIQFATSYAQEPLNLECCKIYTTGAFADTLVIIPPTDAPVSDDVFADWILYSNDASALNFKTEVLQDNHFRFLRVGSAIREVTPDALRFHKRLNEEAANVPFA